MPPPQRGQLVPILLYHHVVSGRPNSPWAISIGKLRQQLELLAESQAATFTASDFAGQCRLGSLPTGPLALVTFDDAHAGVVDLALPVLDELGLRATFFVTTGMLGCRHNISHSALADISDRDLEIGSHTISHPQLDVVSRPAAWDELIRSRAILEELRGRPVTSLSYPHGYHGPDVRELAERAGYETAHAVKNAFSYVGDDLYAVARLTVRADTPTATVADWIHHRGAHVARESEALRTTLWRQYRRLRRLGPRPRDAQHHRRH